MRVEFGNWIYFLCIALAACLSALLVLLCRKKGQVFAYKFVMVLVWANFALHFLKQFLPFYISRWPWGLVDSAFPNLCAVLIFLAPFIMLSKNKYLMDYFCLLGFVSGVLVYFVPTGATRTDVSGFDYVFETVRFYLCHFPLIVCPLIIVTSRIHRLNWRRLWMVPLIFGAILALISLQQFLCGPILKLDGHPHEWLGENGVLNPHNPFAIMSNQSMQFGPQPGVDPILGWLYPYYLPYVLTFPYGGQIYFVPVLWILPIIYLATYLFGPLLCMPFEHEAMKRDFQSFKARIKRKKSGGEGDKINNTR